MKRQSARDRRSQGLSLSEIVIAIAILAAALVPLFNLVTESFRINEASVNEILFTNIANELVDSIVNADAAFAERVCALGDGGSVDLTLMSDPSEQRKFVLSAIPANTCELSYQLERVSGPPPAPVAYTLRVVARWTERSRERLIRLSRYFVPRGPS